MKKLNLVVFLLVGSAVLAACGPPPPAEFTIEMNEYSFTPSNIELQVGQEVTFTLVNVGQLDHEFMVGQGVDNDSEGRPAGYRTDFFASGGVVPVVSGGGMLMDHAEADMGDMEGMDHSDDAGAMSETNMVLQPVGSDSTTINFTVTEDMLGIWEMGCFEQDGVHYRSGMLGSIVVRQ
ncbi:MAG: hypothetical protein DWG76_05665 [Chloroflexi bacterium]|nr:hypothetical protein [Chloroflexota bacterium]